MISSPDKIVHSFNSQYDFLSQKAMFLSHSAELHVFLVTRSPQDYSNETYGPGKVGFRQEQR
jgi:hypothetical protein